MKRINQLIKSFLFIGLCIVCITACASKPKFTGTADLCGLVVDENNKPVKDFVIFCKSEDTNIKMTRINIRPVITNESGLFVFYDLPSGSYTISGQKTNYLQLSETPYQFIDRGKIICLKTKTFKAAIKNAEELIALGQLEDANLLLNGICTEKESAENRIILAYKIIASENRSERKTLINEIKATSTKSSITKQEQDFYKEFISKVEEVYQ